MTPDPATCEPTTALRLVALLMLDHDCAAGPIVRSAEVVGISPTATSPSAPSEKERFTAAGTIMVNGSREAIAMFANR